MNVCVFMARIQRAPGRLQKRFATSTTQRTTNAAIRATKIRRESPSLCSVLAEQTPLQILQMRGACLEPLAAEQHDHGIVIAIRDELAHASPVHQA
jgi:hypothetical protein